MPRLKEVSLSEVSDERVRATYQKHFEGRDPVAVALAIVYRSSPRRVRSWEVLALVTA